MGNHRQQELEQLWLTTGPRLRTWLQCAGGARLDPDDLLQEIFLRAWRKWDQFAARGSRTGWLFGIARNTLLDTFRKKSLPLVGSDALLTIAAQEEVDDAHTETLQAIRKRLCNMSEEQRTVIDLRYAGQLSYAEISQVLGIPVGTVRSRLHRALKSLREKVGHENHT